MVSSVQKCTERILSNAGVDIVATLGRRILSLEMLYGENVEGRLVFDDADKARNQRILFDLNNLGKTVDSLDNSISPEVERSGEYDKVFACIENARADNVIIGYSGGPVTIAKAILGFGEGVGLKQHVRILLDLLVALTAITICSIDDLQETDELKDVIGSDAESMLDLMLLVKAFMKEPEAEDDVQLEVISKVLRIFQLIIANVDLWVQVEGEGSEHYSRKINQRRNAMAILTVWLWPEWIEKVLSQSIEEQSILSIMLRCSLRSLRDGGLHAFLTKPFYTNELNAEGIRRYKLWYTHANTGKRKKFYYDDVFIIFDVNKTEENRRKVRIIGEGCGLVEEAGQHSLVDHADDDVAGDDDMSIVREEEGDHHTFMEDDCSAGGEEQDMSINSGMELDEIENQDNDQVGDEAMDTDDETMDIAERRTSTRPPKKKEDEAFIYYSHRTNDPSSDEDDREDNFGRELPEDDEEARVTKEREQVEKEGDEEYKCDASDHNNDSDDDEEFDATAAAQSADKVFGSV